MRAAPAHYFSTHGSSRLGTEVAATPSILLGGDLAEPAIWRATREGKHGTLQCIHSNERTRHSVVRIDEVALAVHRRLFDGLEGAEHSEGDGEHEDEERGALLATPRLVRPDGEVEERGQHEGDQHGDGGAEQRPHLARGRVTVWVRGRATVWARCRVTVWAGGRLTVWARRRVTVWAGGSAHTVTMSGTKSAPQVAVTSTPAVRAAAPPLERLLARRRARRARRAAAREHARRARWLARMSSISGAPAPPMRPAMSGCSRACSAPCSVANPP